MLERKKRTAKRKTAKKPPEITKFQINKNLQYVKFKVLFVKIKQNR